MTRSCYFPSKRIASDDTPCNATAENSACCSMLATCLANGVCMKDGILSRGSCTDQNWKSDACAPVCQDYNRDGGAVIRLCENTEIKDNIWTCENNGCENPDVTFTLDDLKPTLRPEELSSSYSEVFGNQEATSTATSSTASANANNTAACAASLSSGQIAGVGAGIGVPLLIAFSAVLWLLFAEKKKRKALAATEVLSEEFYPHSTHESRDYKPIKCNAELPNDGRQELLGELQEGTSPPCP